MPENTLNQLKQFEQILKNCIVDRFKANLPEDKKNLLMSTTFLKPEELVGLKTGNEIQGKILRNMLRCIINLKSTKELPLDNGTNITLPIGEDIENEIIEFYASNIADKYKFGINPGNPNLTLAFSLIESLGSNVDNAILNNNIVQIFAQPSVANFAKTYTDELLSPYSIAKTEINDNEPVILVDDPLKNEAVSEEVDILSLAGNNEASVQNVEAPVNEMETISLQPSEEVTPVQEEVKPTTEQEGVISEEKYKELCMKFARNEVLTPQEFNMLLMATPQLVSEEDKMKMANASVDLAEQPEKQEVVFRGFTISAFPTYFVILSVILLVILGVIIL